MGTATEAGRMRNAKIDRTHAEVVQALRACGYGVQSLATVGKGCPDLLVSAKGRWYVLEVKAEKGLLRALQAVWQSNHCAPVHVVRSAEDAVKVVAESGHARP